MQAKQLDRQTFVYDFRETSSSTHQSVVKKVRKAEFNATTFDHSGGHIQCTVLPFLHDLVHVTGAVSSNRFCVSMRILSIV